MALFKINYKILFKFLIVMGVSSIIISPSKAEDPFSQELSMNGTNALSLALRLGHVDGRVEGLQREMIARFEKADEKVDGLRRDMNARFEKADEKLDSLRQDMNARFEQEDKRFEQVDKRFEQVDKRFEQVDKRFGQTDEKVDSLRQDMNARFEQIIGILRNATERYDAFMARTEKRLETLEAHWTNHLYSNIAYNPLTYTTFAAALAYLKAPLDMIYPNLSYAALIATGVSLGQLFMNISQKSFPENLFFVEQCCAVALGFITAYELHQHKNQLSPLVNWAAVVSTGALLAITLNFEKILDIFYKIVEERNNK